MRLLPTVAAVAALASCGHDGAVTGEPQVLVPEDVEVGWDESFNGRDDGRALLVPIDVMVYAPSGEPVEGAPLVLSGTSGALLVGPDAVVTLPADDPQIGWWDAWRDRYFAFSPGEEPVSVLEVETDATGLARGWAFVDRFAIEGGRMAPAQVSVGLGEDDDAFLLIPR